MKILISGEASTPERILIPKKTPTSLEDVDLDKIQALEETLNDNKDPDSPNVPQTINDEVDLRTMAAEEPANIANNQDDDEDPNDLVETEETLVPDVESGRVPVAVKPDEDGTNKESVKLENPPPPPPPKRVSAEDMNMDEAGVRGDVDSGRGVDTVIDRKPLRDTDTSLLRKEIDELKELVL